MGNDKRYSYHIREVWLVYAVLNKRAINRSVVVILSLKGMVLHRFCLLTANNILTCLGFSSCVLLVFSKRGPEPRSLTPLTEFLVAQLCSGPAARGKQGRAQRELCFTMTAADRDLARLFQQS